MCIDSLFLFFFFMTAMVLLPDFYFQLLINHFYMNSHVSFAVFHTTIFNSGPIHN